MTRISNKPRNKLPRSAKPETAPGDMAIVQDFVNSKLDSPKELGKWLARHRLLPASTELTRGDVTRTLAVHLGIRVLLWANSGGKPDEGVLDRLDEAAQGSHCQVRFSRDGSSHFEPLSGTFDGALGYLLAKVMLIRAAGHWPRFKLCADPKCGAAFYDFSKAGTGRWCKVRCGDRVRSSQYRKTDKYKERPSTYLAR